MYRSDVEDNDDFEFSVLDKARIEDLEMGQKIESENGSFLVARQINGYHVWCGRGKRKGVMAFSNLEKVFSFLENN